MIRFLNFLALAAVIGTATWAYSVKYETILVAEKLKKRQTELRHERDAISVLEAEWQLLNRPARLMALAKPGEGMIQMSAKQIVLPKDIPAAAPAKADALDTLLTGTIPATPMPPKSTAGSATPLPKATGAGVGKARAVAKVDPAAKNTKLKDAKAGAPKGSDTRATAKASAAPMSLAPKATAQGAVPKAAPKVGAPTRFAPPAPVGQVASPRQNSGQNSDGLGALFKKILN